MSIMRIATMDIDPLVGAMQESAARFADITVRQAAPGSPHPDTETIYLRFPAEITRESFFEGMDVVDYPACHGALKEAIRGIAVMVGLPPARAMAIKLKPGGIIHPHCDEGGYANATERFHLPIVTNPAALLSCGDDTVHLEAGGLYHFNKHEMHHGINGGDTDRIHLVVDLWR
jgi:hypothetical protein